MNTPLDASSWFYSDRQQTFGPVSTEELAILVQQGQVSRKYMLMPEGGAEWMPVHASPFAEHLPQVAVTVQMTPPAAVKAPQIAKKGRALPWKPVLAVLAAGVAGYFLLGPGAGPPPRRTVERIEAETLRVVRSSSGVKSAAEVVPAKSAVISDGKVFLASDMKVGDEVVLALPVKETARQRVRAILATGRTYRSVSITLDGREVPGSPFDLNVWPPTTTDILDWGVMDLAAGDHELVIQRVKVEGDAASAASFGFDCLLLEPEQRRDAPQPAGADLAAIAKKSSSFDSGILTVSDGKWPRSMKSNDFSVPALSTWPNRSALEWAQYEWETPQFVNAAEIFFADETQTGLWGSLPHWWRLLYRQESGAWAPVEAEFPAARLDGWTTIRFPTVRTTALRLMVQCAAVRSAGIHEWKVSAAAPEVKPTAKTPRDLFLGELAPLRAKLSYDRYHTINQHSSGLVRRDLCVGGKLCTGYLWAHAPSRLDFAIPVGYTQFKAHGITNSFPDSRKPAGHGHWKYIVRVDEKVVFESKLLQTYPNKEISITLPLPAGARVLSLIVDPAGSDNADHAYWGNPVLSAGGDTLSESLPGTQPAPGQKPLTEKDVYRTWTDTRGRKLEATFRDIEGENVFLQARDGFVHRLPLTNLRVEDQEIVKNLKPEEILPGTQPAPELKPLTEKDLLGRWTWKSASGLKGTYDFQPGGKLVAETGGKLNEKETTWKLDRGAVIWPHGGREMRLVLQSDGRLRGITGTDNSIFAERATGQ
ncbi:MAG: NPCBM/NEW2 domain-containing protein [Prosthecobacter sp.]|jgi:hypothetical protein|uniref:NPCBM/NEW2 domain-containing protein n=1 Tax=Prosthecobacter sp. TaxID=1965333 RepID=UPI0019DF529E|nr:NPCBM/NEW2 domain-containing protein [Prosthecobacter sp.]MBE2282864.1 NPCBM/NEW2 domain-containing protein [Prosthecobacter sp.]